MIIVVEGIDRVGKTTLCNCLSEKYKIKIYHNDVNYMKLSEMDNKNETDKTLKLISLCEQLGQDIIFDRLHWSDYVYGVTERGYDTKEAIKNKDIIDKKLNEIKSVLIFVKPTDIEWSSKQHGKDLSGYEARFEMLYKYSCIKNKIMTDYNNIKEGISKL
jgi:thymidylate kinase